MSASRPAQNDPSGRQTKSSAGPFLEAILFGGLWPIIVIGWAVAQYGVHGAITPSPLALAGIAGLAIGPCALLSLVGARNSSAIRRDVARMVDVFIDEQQHSAADSVASLREVALTLRSELNLLDEIVYSATERLTDCVAVAKEDGGELAQLLSEDLAQLREVQDCAVQQNEALEESIHRAHAQFEDAIGRAGAFIAQIEEATARQLDALRAQQAAMALQCESVREAAKETEISASNFDLAIAKTLDALTHATSLNEAARRSADESAAAAQTAARAVFEATTQGANEGRGGGKLLQTKSAGQPIQPIAAPKAEEAPARARPSRVRLHAPLAERALPANDSDPAPRPRPSLRTAPSLSETRTRRFPQARADDAGGARQRLSREGLAEIGSDDARRSPADEQYLRVRQLLAAGYSTRRVIRETGYPPSQVRLWAELEKAAI